MQIPVSFIYQGKHYKGHLNQVSGAATSLYHLIINGYYKGQLFYTENGWQMDGEFQELKDFFEAVLIGWHE